MLNVNVYFVEQIWMASFVQNDKVVSVFLAAIVIGPVKICHWFLLRPCYANDCINLLLMEV